MSKKSRRKAKAIKLEAVRRLGRECETKAFRQVLFAIARLNNWKLGVGSNFRIADHARPPSCFQMTVGE